MTNGRNNNNFKMPKKLGLPFFAYGLFDPRGNAYSKIKHYIIGDVIKDANYRSIKKDGIQVLIRIWDDNYKTSGHVLRFNDKKNAYKEICDIISNLNLSDKFIWDTIEIENKLYNTLVLKGPEDINLPFFTYGIFKPGEIAYSEIKKYINPDGKNKAVINYGMRHRDGVPILLPKSHQGDKTCGYILSFNDKKNAYKVIDEIISEELYYWDTIDIESEPTNVLFGNRPYDGSNSIDDSSDRMNFKGKKDPVFDKGMKLIREYLESEFPNNKKYYKSHWDDEDINRFFKLQMHYMFLWSAIDRYCKLKYNKDSEVENREKLSNEDSFKNALKNIPYPGNYRPIFTTDDLSMKIFNINKSNWCMNYYYTLRCNIVHRMKSNGWDIELLKQATWDLLDIFQYIINETFK